MLAESQTRALSLQELLDIPTDRFQFPFTNWRTEFGIYKYFYVRGQFRNVRVSHLEHFKREAIENIPLNWVEEFPEGDWKSISHIQLSNIIRGYNSRLDKCAMYMVCASYIFGMYRQVDNIRMKISPAIFVVDGIEKITSLPKYKDIIAEISSAISQPISFVISSVRDGFPMTITSADAMVNFIRDTVSMDCNVRMLTDRADRNRYRRYPQKTPNKYEVVS
jgi:hypothetical protein